MRSRFNGSITNSLKHASEHDVVKRNDGKPVEAPKDSSGGEFGRLYQRNIVRAVGRPSNLKFQLRDARKSHFGAKLEPPVFFNSSDSPKVECITVSNGVA